MAQFDSNQLQNSYDLFNSQSTSSLLNQNSVFSFENLKNSNDSMLSNKENLDQINIQQNVQPSVRPKVQSNAQFISNEITNSKPPFASNNDQYYGDNNAHAYSNNLIKRDFQLLTKDDYQSTEKKLKKIHKINATTQNSALQNSDLNRNQINALNNYNSEQLYLANLIDQILRDINCNCVTVRTDWQAGCLLMYSSSLNPLNMNPLILKCLNSYFNYKCRLAQLSYQCINSSIENYSPLSYSNDYSSASFNQTDLFTQNLTPCEPYHYNNNQTNANQFQFNNSLKPSTPIDFSPLKIRPQTGRSSSLNTIDEQREEEANCAAAVNNLVNNTPSTTFNFGSYQSDLDSYRKSFVSVDQQQEIAAKQSLLNESKPNSLNGNVDFKNGIVRLEELEFSNALNASSSNRTSTPTKLDCNETKLNNTSTLPAVATPIAPPKIIKSTKNTPTTSPTKQQENDEKVIKSEKVRRLVRLHRTAASRAEVHLNWNGHLDIKELNKRFHRNTVISSKVSALSMYL